MRKYKIIIVENDEDEQEFLKESFETTGLFEIVEQLDNGDALLEWLKKYPSSFPEIILSDLNMPGKNGYDVLKELNANPAYAHIPVIIMSTSSVQSIINKCLALGAAHYLIKPDTFIDYVPFIENLRTVVDKNQMVK